MYFEPTNSREGRPFNGWWVWKSSEQPVTGHWVPQEEGGQLRMMLGQVQWVGNVDSKRQGVFLYPAFPGSETRGITCIGEAHFKLRRSQPPAGKREGL
jgi:hypothetical protein